MPEGLDSDIWSMVLLFEQYAEQNGFSTVGRPIMYTELYHRVAADKELSQLLRSTDTSIYTGARYVGIDGIDVSPLVVLEDMIHLYWTTSNNFDYNHSINNFCSIEVFNWIKDYVVATTKRELLHSTGERILLKEKQKLPSRRTDDEKVVFEIINSPRTEEESMDKIEHWKTDIT
jgi:hypothetical protein